MRLFGYACASNPQSLESQMLLLKKNGIKDNFLFVDTSTNGDGLNQLQETVRSGDNILLTRFEQLGRNTVDTIRIIKEFYDEGIGVSFIDDGITTTGQIGKVVIDILSVIYQSEKRRIIEHMNIGRANAIANGIKLGRKPSVDKEKVCELHKKGVGATKIAQQLDIGRSTVYRVLDEKVLEQ